MAIGVSGLMSGLDTESIITQMMSIERRPVLLLQQQEARIQGRISAMGSLKSGLAGLQSAIRTLKSASGYSKMQATSGNTTALAATATASAVAGKYKVEVTALAVAQQVKSSAFAVSDTEVGTGTLTIKVGAKAAVNVTIDATNNTLSGIAQAINKANTDVIAGVIFDGSDYYLTLSSKETGAGNTISLTMADADLVNDDASGLSKIYFDPATQSMSQTQAAVDADLTVNGIAVTRSGNTISDLIEGVTLTLKQTDAGNPFELTVAQDSGAVTTNINNFVTQYNTLIDTLKLLRGYDPETKEAGLLLGDSLTRQVEGQVRAFIHRQFGDQGQAVRRLSDLGLSQGQDGKLSLNETTLSSALADNPEAVKTFFTSTATGSEGFAVQLDTLLDGYLKGTGLLVAKQNGLNSSVSRIGDQVERIELRLAKREENLRRQFESLESLMGQFQNTSGVLSQQLEALTNLNAQIAKKR